MFIPQNVTGQRLYLYKHELAQNIQNKKTICQQIPPIAKYIPVGSSRFVIITQAQPVIHEDNKSIL